MLSHMKYIKDKKELKETKYYMGLAGEEAKNLHVRNPKEEQLL